MRFVSWAIRRWHARQRAIDLQILWPSCRAAALRHGADLDVAKAAFATHAFNDSAWTELGEDEICRRIDDLT